MKLLFVPPKRATERERRLGKKAWAKILRHQHQQPRSWFARKAISEALLRYSWWLWDRLLDHDVNRRDWIMDFVGADDDALIQVKP